MISKTIQNNIIKLSKHCYKSNKISRPIIAGAYIQDNKQCCCDGYIGAMYDEITPNTQNTATNSNGVNMNYIINKYKKSCKIKIVDNEKLINQINTALKEFKKNNKGYKGNIYIQLYNNAIFNVKLFNLIADTMQEPKIFINNSEYPTAYIKGLNGEGIVLGIKANTKDVEANGIANGTLLKYGVEV